MLFLFFLKKCAQNVCRCERGYLRDKNGKCIKASECPKTIIKEHDSSKEKDSGETKEWIDGDEQ